jgi:predicted nucleic acid-binding protein
MESADEDRLFLSVITLAELHFGVARMPAGVRKTRIERWLQFELRIRFEKRVVPVTEQVAEAWGRVVSECESVGHPISAMDGFLAATAQVYDFTLVTRNVGHFGALKKVISPWT